MYIDISNGQKFELLATRFKKKIHNDKEETMSVCIYFFLNFRTSMEESSHSTPSPMSSAASSQDSLHRNAATLHYHQQLHHQNPYGNMMTNTLPANTHMSPYVNKKKGVKSTLGRIFGKKDKSHQRALQAASAAASGVRSPAGMSLGSPQVFTYIFLPYIFCYFFQL